MNQDGVFGKKGVQLATTMQLPPIFFALDNADSADRNRL
jgi:hypothetical protein